MGTKRHITAEPDWFDTEPEDQRSTEPPAHRNVALRSDTDAEVPSSPMDGARSGVGPTYPLVAPPRLPNGLPPVPENDESLFYIPPEPEAHRLVVESSETHADDTVEYETFPEREEVIELVNGRAPQPPVLDVLDVPPVAQAPPVVPPPPPGAAMVVAGPPDSPATGPAAAAEVFSMVRRIAVQPDLSNVETLFFRALSEWVSIDRVRIHYFNPEESLFWRYGDSPLTPSIDTGLSMKVLRTSGPVVCARATADGSYDARVDDPDGDGNERLVCFPIASGPQLVGTCTIVRSADGPEFASDDLALFESLCSSTAPILLHFVLRHLSEVRERHVQDDDLFRAEALDHRAAQKDSNGSPIRVAPEWIRWSYRCVWIAGLFALAFSLLGSVEEYSNGPALIQMGGERITAHDEGTVAELFVRSGARVEKGELLARLYSGRESDRVHELRTDYENQLAAFLVDPGDSLARKQLSSSAAALEGAERSLRHREVRATTNGRIGDLRVRKGMMVRAGEHIATISDEKATPRVLAFLPGADLPMLKEGMSLRLDLKGYRTRRIEAVVDEIGTQVIGPVEAQRYLGSQAGATQFTGPVVMVFADLVEDSFKADGDEYGYRDGMSGSAEVEMRSERILFSFIPGLKEIF